MKKGGAKLRRNLTTVATVRLWRQSAGSHPRVLVLFAN